MSTPAPTCARCRVAMEEGYLLDRGHGNYRDQAQWVEGGPDRIRWLGVDFGVQTKDREVLKVSTWRCPRCGLLESYATVSAKPG